MVNVRAIANAFTSGINPNVVVTYRASSGNTVDANYKPVPAYATDVQVAAQIQPMSSTDLLKVNGLNLQGVKSKIYMNGAPTAVVRRDVKGGDLFVINGATWLVAQVLEDWPDWSSICIVEQVDT